LRIVKSPVHAAKNIISQLQTKIKQNFDRLDGVLKLIMSFPFLYVVLLPCTFGFPCYNNNNNSATGGSFVSEVYDFLKSCGIFFVLTINGEAPAGRPFGVVMEHDGNLFISTKNTKDVYTQLSANPNLQIIAMKQDSRDWVRISGNAIECNDLTLKQRMLDECPVLVNHFSSANCSSFALFKVLNMVSYLNNDNGAVRLD